ncbi:MAG: N-formylglutamate amidohydrolase [Cognatishimia sp.]|uniref:N-formylglutamate amidohydrolase n=1 Tax=Cognatishimia sp. TaxID=2211648 RepID=UPI0040584A34
MTESAFEVDQPQTRSSAVVFASPHSGRIYPKSFLEESILDAHVVRSSEDAFVDQLFAAAPRFGAPLLKALAPRAFVDLNRSPDELDPALIRDVRAVGNNPRVASGLGVIPRVVSNGRAIYRGKISKGEAERRLNSIWHPYHAALQQLLDEAFSEFGEAILVDCHSMPREALDSLRTSKRQRPEVVLGDRFGTSASGEIVDQIEAGFVAQGFRVSRNMPFAGAYICQNYGRLGRNQHAVQVEIDRSLYMHEASITPLGDFEDVQTRLGKVVAHITQIGGKAQPLAAE